MHANQTRQLLETPQAKPTEIHHLALGVGGAIGCTLANRYIVGKGWLSSEHSSIALALLGAGAMYVGWKYDQPAVTWAAAGWTFAGVARITKDLCDRFCDDGEPTETAEPDDGRGYQPGDPGNR